MKGYVLKVYSAVTSGDIGLHDSFCSESVYQSSLHEPIHNMQKGEARYFKKGSEDVPLSKS